MSAIYLGKISKQFPQQFERNFYGGGKPDSTWYGGLKPGDYVFPIYNSYVSKLWRVKGFSSEPNEINQEGSIQFEVVKEYGEGIPISSSFPLYKYFSLDLILLNKIAKSTATEEKGFFVINTDEGCPIPERIDFTETRNIYIALANPFQPVNYKDGDIRIRINNNADLRIEAIETYKEGTFQPYQPLTKLYNEKNKEGERYTLKELYQFAIQDNAENKKEYLKSVMDELSKTGYFNVPRPIGFYDNILVGRKKTKSKKTGEEKLSGQLSAKDIDDDDDRSEELNEEFHEYIDLLDSNPNLILYGPPGTGKTYSASKIIETVDHSKSNVFKTFKEIEKEGRVDFVTFHQSFSYEEFVEGLRPVIKNDVKEKDDDEGSDLQYKIQDGILKQIANKAALSQIKSEYKSESLEQVGEENTIWKISLGRVVADEVIYKDCIKSGVIAIGFISKDISGWNQDEIYDELKKEKSWKSDNPLNDARSIDYFLNQMQIGDVVLVFASVTSIRAIGVVAGEYKYEKSLESYKHRRAVKWLKQFDEPVNIIKYNNGVKLTQQTLYPLSRFKFSDIKEILSIGQEINNELVSETPYYLIIDEINRGNISKIFGELITLIEKDKRNIYSCKLPYSQKPFSLPSNLYIIGTMNTADRSIAVLDIALRRRFFFKEIEPNKQVIIDNNPIIKPDLDLANLFEALNNKISTKLDRDHRIGHYHFLKVYTIEKFKLRWYYQIIPLLMEYFYNDATSIADIIGEAFIDPKTSQVRWIDSNSEFKTALLAIK